MSSVLTVRRIETMKPDAKRIEVPDGVISGLYLVVQPSGKKSFALRYRFRGQPRKLTIGKYPGIELADARDLARAALDKVGKGQDPAREHAENKRRGLDKSRLVETQLERFIKYTKDVKKRRKWAETERMLNLDAVPVIGKLAVEQVTKRDIRDILLASQARGATVGVNRLQSALSQFFKWALADGLIEETPVVGIHIRHEERSRDRVLDDSELLEIWTAAPAAGEVYCRIVRLLMLTGQRRGEVSTLRPIDVAAKTWLWTIPAERSKNGRAHDVYLTPFARELVGNLEDHEPDAFVFSNDGGSTALNGWAKPKTLLDAAILEARTQTAKKNAKVEAMAHWTLHDLRRTAASGMARMGFDLHVIEKVLNHVSGTFGGVLGVYQRHEFAEERQRALEAWSAHIESLVGGEVAPNVFKLPTRAEPAGRR